MKQNLKDWNRIREILGEEVQYYVDNCEHDVRIDYLNVELYMDEWKVVIELSWRGYNKVDRQSDCIKLNATEKEIRAKIEDLLVDIHERLECANGLIAISLTSLPQTTKILMPYIDNLESQFKELKVTQACSEYRVENGKPLIAFKVQVQDKPTGYFTQDEVVFYKAFAENKAEEDLLEMTENILTEYLDKRAEKGLKNDR